MSKTTTFDAMTECYYILRLDSYYGDNSSLTCEADEMDYMYAVLLVTPDTAEIIDWGYSSVEQLLDAWKDVGFVDKHKQE